MPSADTGPVPAPQTCRRPASHSSAASASPVPLQYNRRFFHGPALPMIDPRRVLRALAEHWALLEPLCERFDAGTLSLAELRSQLNTQLPESNPAEITALLDQWIRLDILVPVAKSPNRFEPERADPRLPRLPAPRASPWSVPGDRGLPAPSGAPRRVHPGRLRDPRQPGPGAPAATARHARARCTEEARQ